MLRGQETLLSSSSRRETPPPPPDKFHHAKSIGCVSAVFHFLSRYQHRRKFLTFGKKHEKVAQTKSSSVACRERFSWDVPRSPAIPTEIRLSKSMNFPEHDHRLPPALVTGHFPKMEYNNFTLEERRKLMSDLEKCDEDLKELTKIIETVRFSERLRSPPALKRLNTFGRGGENMVKKRPEYYSTSEQPSPVSVLDELTRSPLISAAYSSRRHIANGQMPMPIPQQRKPGARKKPGEDDVFDSTFFNNLAAESLRAKREAMGSPIWSSNAMVESVDEVCKDIAWGEKREIGRIGLAIQDFICRDLIEEIVKECSRYTSMYSLPLQACKKRLCF